MGYLFRGGLENDVRSVGKAIDNAVIQPIVDNPAAVIGLGLNFMAPGLGTAIGTALGATGAAAAVVGGAVIGGATAELAGGDFINGAIGGGIGAGLGQLAQGASGAGTVAGNAADMTVMTADQLGQSFENTMSAAGYQPVGAAITGALDQAPAPEVAPAPAPDYNVQPEVIQGPAPEVLPAPVLPEVPVPEVAPPAFTNPTEGAGYYDELTGQYIQDPAGGLTGPLDSSSGTAPIVESNYANGQWTMPGNTPIDAPLSTGVQTGADIMPAPVAPAAPTKGPGYYDEITGQYIEDPNGVLQAPLTPESGTFPITESNYANGQWTMPGNTPVDAPLSTGTQTGADVMASAGAQPTTGTNNVVKQLLGATATTAGTAAGLMGSGAPTGAGEDQVFGKSTQSKYSFDQSPSLYTPQSLMTISQLLGRR